MFILKFKLRISKRLEKQGFDSFYQHAIKSVSLSNKTYCLGISLPKLESFFNVTFRVYILVKNTRLELIFGQNKDSGFDLA